MATTRETFEQQCKRRFGTSNPERMHLSHWEWMVRSGEDPFLTRGHLGLEPNYPSCTSGGCRTRNEPDWCFARFGMSRTLMPDGRTICIAGEHEDSYDPDFCIYNDVIVLRPDPGETGVALESGGVEIYGYPESVLAPTDFHSATLVNGRIFVIGRLGYMGTRRTGTTPVVAVDTETYRVEQIAPIGPCPGWVYKHHSSYDPAAHAIAVRGGKVHVEGDENETPNLAAHRLYLADLRWEIISRRETHRRFLLERVDDDNPEFHEPTAEAFRPRHVPYVWLMPEEHGVPVYGLDIQGVRVTFEEFYSTVRALVEGDLPSDVTHQVLMDIQQNLSQGTGSDWSLQEVESFGED